ncbi:sugar ABC transporter permease [Acrocarpospora phusangensis]|uniref:Maltose/maltodextrin transport system permease protein n=1 Tax=Acrocarpospora phusangensis TaxID=1070424 RepID=A0A919Q808_9ACTN|nr:sugar ABC transporter permease [Acrocarpospora phusangensis]
MTATGGGRLGVRRPRRPRPADGRTTSVAALAGKIVLLGAVNALAVFGLLTSFAAGDWGIFGFVAISTVIADYVYFSKRVAAGKYLLPGLLFLLVFQVYIVLHTVAAAFTNVGDGHNLDKPRALEHILAVSEKRVPDSPLYRVAVVTGSGGTLELLATDPAGQVTLNGEPVTAGVTRDSTGKATALDGYRTLQLRDLTSRQEEVLDLRVPLGTQGALRTQDGATGFLARPALRHDPAADTLTDVENGQVYRASATGYYEAADGTHLTPGWTENVGFDNFARVLTDTRLRGPFVSVFIWTFVFAALSVLFNFALGLLLALALNKPGMKGRNLYRSLLVLPYAVPSFLSALVWTGMLNQTFGFVNQTLLGGADVPWLNDPWLAKGSVLLVNLWLGFPYMFLVCTGALQAIPTELNEAAKIDGAGPWQHFRQVTLPLLLVSTAPLLVAAFAFNFNNFTVIYFVTGGGPNIPEAPITLGSTDLLISMVYKIAFGGAGREWGFASAMSALIFVIVAGISAFGLRRTRSLEETYS